jgi:hypothetical protein
MREFKGLAPIRRSNQQLKSDAEDMAAGRLGLSEGEIEQIAGAGQAAAANQAAQDQQAIARSSMGQPGFLGEAAKQSAEVSGQAAQAASTARASTLAMNADVKRRQAERITTQLAQAADSRRQAIATGIGTALMGASMIGGAVGGGAAAITPAVATAAGKGAGVGVVERVKANVASRQMARDSAALSSTSAEEAARLAEVGGYRRPGQPPPPPLGWGDDLPEDEE